MVNYVFYPNAVSAPSHYYPSSLVTHPAGCEVVMVECQSGGASVIWDPHVASRRQTDRHWSPRWDDSRLLVWSMPASLSDASTHTNTLFLSWTIKHNNTFFFLCVSVNIITMRHFPQAEVFEIYMATKRHFSQIKKCVNTTTLHNEY